MKKETEKKRHINCGWLMKKKQGFFQCCDARGPLKGKEVGNEEVNKTCCQFFHAKNIREFE